MSHRLILKGEIMSKETQLSSDNCMTLIGKITVGSWEANITYKNKKGRKRVILQLGDIPDGWTEEQLNEYLKGIKVFLPDTFIDYPKD